MRKKIDPKTRVLALLAGFAAVAGVVLALAPWTVSSDALREAVARQLATEVGLAFTETGRTTIAFLPTPRVKFENVVIRGDDGSEVIRAGALRGQLAWGPLLYGRLRLTDVSLAQARILVAVDETGRSAWDEALARLAGRIEGRGPSTVDGLVLVDTSILYSDAASRRREVLRDADLAIAWADPSGPLAVNGTIGMRGEIVRIDLGGLVPAALTGGARSPIDLTVSGRLGRLAVTGTVSAGRDSPWLAGRVAVETRSAREALAWTGLQLPLGALIGAASLEGDASGVGRSLSFPTVRMTLGSDRLDGALAARMQDGRLAVTGTLAAETLDLTSFAAPLVAATDPADPGRGSPISLARHAGADLDLRLSATTARVGRARLGEVALSVIVAPGRIEASLSRARLAEGEIRGRLAMTSPRGPTELRLDAQGSGVSLAALGRDLGTGWIAGPASGDIQLAGAGETVQALLADLDGAVTLEVGAGEFVGIDLAEALRRFERQPLTAAQTLRSGRTPFQSAAAALAVEDGIARFVEAGFESAQLNGILEGSISLLERRIDAKAAVESRTPVGADNLLSALTFALEGPLTNVSLVPDAKALIQRSGAARFLLGPSVEPPALLAPAAQAQ